MPTSNGKFTTLLSAVTATGAGTAINVPNEKIHTFSIIASSVTSGGTMVLQATDFAGNVCTLQSVTVSANGNTIYTFAGFFAAVNANLSARTDGTFTVNYAGSDGSRDR